MGNPMMQLHLTLVTFKGLCEGHSDFESPLVQLHLTLVTLGP